MSMGSLLALAGLAIVDSTSFGTLGIPVYLLLASERSRLPGLFVYLATVAGGWLEPRLARLRDWMSRNSMNMVSRTLAVAGVLLALDALGNIGLMHGWIDRGGR